MCNALVDDALGAEFIQPDPVPFVLQTANEDFYVAYQLNAFTIEPA